MKVPTQSPAQLLTPGRALTFANVAEGAEGLVVSDLARAVAARPKPPAVSLAVVCRDGPRMQQLARALEFFAPDLELRRVITHYLEERVEKQLNAGRNRLREITLAIPRAGNGSANPLRDRFKSLQAWHHRSRMFLPAIKALLKLPV